MLTVSLVPALAQEGEKKVGIDQVPAKVKAAILKAVGDGRLVDIGVFMTKMTKEQLEAFYLGAPQPTLFHWQWKIKQILDPNDAGDSRMYITLEKPPE